MKDLIEEAKNKRPVRKVYKSKTKYEYNDSQIELALAWVAGEVSVADVCRVMDMSVKNRASAYNFLAKSLKKYLQSPQTCDRWEKMIDKAVKL